MRLEESVKENATWEGEVWAGRQRRKKECVESEGDIDTKTADRQTHTHKHTDRGHTATPATRHSDKLAVKCSISRPN